MTPFHLDRRMLKNMDWLLLICIAVITFISVAMIYSASKTVISGDPGHYLKRQAIALAVSLVALVFGVLLDYSYLQRFYKSIYVGMLILQVLVFFLGEVSDYGGLRWIPIGPYNLQPSEVAKICLILSLASFLDRFENITSFGPILQVIIAMGIPMLAVLMQPDLGTATVLIVVTGGLLFLYGVPWRYLAGLIGAGLAALPILWIKLSDEQKLRIYVFLDPYNSKYGKEAWQLIQSIIAIGSGGLWGSGYLQGTQTQLRFLPEKHTDFIFSTVAEELGFVGAALLIVTYLILIWRIFSISATARDRFGRLVSGGVGFMLLYHLLVNVGMTLGIMPITGIPLPLVSYAASNLLTVMLALGIVLSIGLRRTKSIF